MNNLLARSLGIFLICIFLIAEYYSISSAFSDGLQEFSDDGLGHLCDNCATCVDEFLTYSCVCLSLMFVFFFSTSATMNSSGIIFLSMRN